MVFDENLPSVSVVIPTYNSSKTLATCLDSIMNQDYPKDKVEVIVVDGGSKDNTLEVAMHFGACKVAFNPLRTGEAGKAVGVGISKNEIVAFIDSDNILPSSDWLLAMTKPFLEDDGIVATEPLYYSYRMDDPLITRYCALTGMNDILCLYLGNYDRYSYLTGKWTGLPVSSTDRGSYMLVELDEENIPTIGANGFLVRVEVLRKVDFRPYLFDIDVVHQLVRIGFNRIAKVKVGIIHLYATDIKGYVRKTRRRISDYLYYHRKKERSYPWTRLGRNGIQRFVLSTLFFPMAITVVARGYRNQPDRAWFFHPFACWSTLLIYGFEFLMKS